MSSIDRFLIKLNAQISQYVLPSTIKKVVTILVLAFTIYYAYDRINRNRRRLTHNRTTPATTAAATQRQPHSNTAALRSSVVSNSSSSLSASSSPSSSFNSSSSASSSVNRLLNTLSASSSLSATQLKDSVPLTAADKYLHIPAIPPRLVLISTANIVLTPTASPTLVHTALPVLLQLARCCQLVLVTQVGVDEGGEAREKEVRRVLKDAGVIEAGLKEHVSSSFRHVLIS